jgi:hypothetical protein
MIVRDATGTLGNKPAAYAFIKLEDKAQPGSHEVRAVLAELAPLVQESSNPAKVK